VIGHQWTNIGIFICNRLIPLPPLVFLTKRECKLRGIDYKTELEKVIN